MASKQIQTVDQFMDALEHPLKKEIDTIRQIILQANSHIAERVKWNAPSFYYKFDMAAFMLRPTDHIHLTLVFPGGVMLADRYDFLEGDYKDRRLAKFYGMKDIEDKRERLVKIVNEWVNLVTPL